MLLSICIPTYNRSQQLKRSLSLIIEQTEEYQNKIEIIVSDNNSTDETQSVIQEFKKISSIQYNRNKTNIGAVQNIVNLPNHFASGKYCWVIGDDDFIRPGAIRSIVTALEKHPDLDYFYINYSCHDPSEYLEFGELPKVQETTLTGDKNTSERLTDRWEQLIKDDQNALTPIYCSIFRRALWKIHSKNLRLSDEYSCVDSTYPQTIILARALKGKPAWASGYPWLLMFKDQVSWANYIPAIYLLRFQELLNEMESLGIDKSITEIHRNKFSTFGAKISAEVLLGKKYPKISRLEILKHILSNSHNQEFKKLIYITLKNIIKNKIKGAIRRIYNTRPDKANDEL